MALSLQRIDKRIRHQQRVVHAVFLGKFELPCLAYDAIEIAPHVEHARQIIDERLEDRIVGLNRDPLRALTRHPDGTDDVTHVAWFIHHGVAYGYDAIPEHALALTAHDGQWQAAVVVLARND